MRNRILAVVSLLKGNAGFTAVMGAGAACRLYPLVGNADAGDIYAVYNIASEPMTKDARRYPGTLQVHFPVGKFTEMIDFAELCGDLLDAAGYDVGFIENDYNAEFTTLYSTINFLIE